jgi:hypothetical protein
LKLSLTRQNTPYFFIQEEDVGQLLNSIIIYLSIKSINKKTVRQILVKYKHPYSYSYMDNKDKKIIGRLVQVGDIIKCIRVSKILLSNIEEDSNIATISFTETGPSYESYFSFKNYGLSWFVVPESEEVECILDFLRYKKETVYSYISPNI